MAPRRSQNGQTPRRCAPRHRASRSSPCRETVGWSLPHPTNGVFMTLDLQDPPRLRTEIRQPMAPPWRLWLLRLGVVALALVLWFWTQSLLGDRPVPTRIGDGLHDLTAGANVHLLSNPESANALLITSSALIDMLGVFILVSTIV